jgi:hypothetical protein
MSIENPAAFNPVWIAVAISILNLIFSAVGIYIGVRVAMARFEARQDSQGDSLDRLEDQVDTHGGLLADHQVRISVIENEVGLRQPSDYPRRG